MSFDPAATRRIGRRGIAVSQLGVGTAPFGSFSDAAITDAAIGGAFAYAVRGRICVISTRRRSTAWAWPSIDWAPALRTIDRRIA